MNIIEPDGDTKWELSVNVEPPKSKWDSEDEEIPRENNEIENEEKQMEIENVIEQGWIINILFIIDKKKYTNFFHI